MPRISTGEPKVRLNLELNERVRDRLERLRFETEADSLAEVIRRALALYDTMVSTTRDDKAKIIVRTADGEERELMIF